MSIIGLLERLSELPKVAWGKNYTRYNSGKCKNLFSRCMNLIVWLCVEREVLRHYYALGFETKSWPQIRSYISQYRFLKLENKANQRLSFSKILHEISFWTGESHLSSSILVGDKFVSAAYMKGLGLPCVENLILFDNGAASWNDGRNGTLDEVYGYLKERSHPVYLKQVDGFGGNSVYKMVCGCSKLCMQDKEISKDDFCSLFTNGRWIIQDNVIQHHELSRVFPNATNCLRVNTVLRNGKPEIFASFMKFGVGNCIMDNWDLGGILIGVQDDLGYLQPKGYYNPKTKSLGTCLRHPDSRVLFEGFNVPYYQESVELCLKAHRYFYSRIIIGWDIIITDNGPVILEANSNPSITAIQMLFGDMKATLRELYESNFTQEKQYIACHRK